MRRVGAAVALGSLVVSVGCATPAAQPTRPVSDPPPATVVDAGQAPGPPTEATGAALVASGDSSTTVQAQYRSDSCHQRGSGLFALPDPTCTPGALNPAVTQATIASTICRSGYTRTIRPASSVTGAEKIGSLASYGDPDQPSAFEYDHLISLELGGAANDPRNLWPEPGPSPNPKDGLENKLHALVCSRELSLAAAQSSIATNWVGAYRTYVGGRSNPTIVVAPAPAVEHRPTGDATGSDAPVGATAKCNDGTYSYATHHSGACSHHGGVAMFYR